MSNVSRPMGHPDAVGRAIELVRLFHDQSEWGDVVVESAAMDRLSRTLLAHRGHMTVAIESWIGGPVEVTVIQERRGQSAGSVGENVYAREILLTGHFAGAQQLLQYGIVRIDLTTVPGPVAQLIREGRIPLGRVLISAGVHRDIQDVELVSIRVGRALSKATGQSAGGILSGRVATIRLGFEASPASDNDDATVAAVELLEVLIPVKAAV